MRSPAAGQRQRTDAAFLATQPLEHPRTDARQRLVQRRTQRRERPGMEGRAFVPGPQAALDLAFAQLAQQVGQRNLHRTDDAALPAQCCRLRQVEGVLDADVARRQHRAHRSRIDPPVGVTTDLLIHGAVVHAGAAADAAQHVLELAAEQPGAPGIHQHEIQVLGAVELAGPARPGQQGEIVRDRLTRRRARQQPHDRGRVLQRRQHLLDAGKHDVHARQHRAHALVALVGDQRDRPGLGDQEVRPGHAHVCRKKVASQDLARLARQLTDLGPTRFPPRRGPGSARLPRRPSTSTW
jgi:hypothetical protein